MTLVPLETSEPDDLTCAYFKLEEQPSVAVVQFCGAYPTGTHGNTTADWMRQRTIYALIIGAPIQVLIMDLRKFHYSMGNRLLNVWQEAEYFLAKSKRVTAPVLTVTGPDCDERLRSLFDVFWMTGNRPILNSMDAAIEKAMAMLTDDEGNGAKPEQEG